MRTGDWEKKRNGPLVSMEKNVNRGVLQNYQQQQRVVPRVSVLRGRKIIGDGTAKRAGRGKIGRSQKKTKFGW